MTQQLSTWIERLARFGFAAKGIVYAIVGVLAAQSAFTTGGKTTDAQGALQSVIAQPFGKVLLSLIAIGLVGYVLWRWVEAIVDPENKGTDAKGIFQRLGYGLNGLVYAGLALSAVQLLLGSSSGDSSTDSAQDWTARLLSQPFGQWLVGTIGSMIIGLGFYEFYEAYSAKFREKLKLDEMSDTEKTWATRLGRLGLVARGIVFVLIGVFLIQAARQSDPNQARGLDGTLQVLAQQPYGPWILALVAIGLVAYGIHMGVQARYRKLVTQRLKQRVDTGS